MVRDSKAAKTVWAGTQNGSQQPASMEYIFQRPILFLLKKIHHPAEGP